MSKRKFINPRIEAEVLLNSRRRCCLCFGLERDFNIKKGQIAHIDRNSSNPKIENLTFLCFNHHDEYDSQTSQSKGISVKELNNYKIELQKHIIEWETQKRSEQIGKPIEKKENYNQFIVYKIFNLDSVCGYKFLAINKTNTMCISFSDNHISFQRMYWEIKQWLNCDYQKNGELFQFELSFLDKMIYDELLENDYSLTAYFGSKKMIDNLTMTFNTGHQYYEMEFELKGQILKKTTNNGYQQLESEISIATKIPAYYDFFKKIGDLIIELRNQKWIENKIFC